LVKICVQQLQSREALVVVAAIRCLIAIGALSAIPIETICPLVQSRQMVLRLVATVALAGLVDSGLLPPVDVVDALMDEVEANPVAETLLALLCKDQDLAKVILKKIADGWRPGSVAAIRLLVRISSHQPLRREIKIALRTRAIPSDEPFVTEAVGLLTKSL
jgi:hypothetical protein